MGSLQTCAEKGTVMLSTSLAWPAVAVTSQAETFSQLSAISFAQPCTSFSTVFDTSPVRLYLAQEIHCSGKCPLATVLFVFLNFF